MSLSEWYRNALKAYSDTAWKNASFESNLSSVAVQKLLRLSWDMSKQKITCWANCIKSHNMIQNWLKNTFYQTFETNSRHGLISCLKTRLSRASRGLKLENFRNYVKCDNLCREKSLRNELSCKTGFWPPPFWFLITSKRIELESWDWSQMKRLFKSFLGGT